MKNKISKQLTLYFSIILIIFSISIGLIFSVLFRKNVVDINKVELEKRATTIASTISTFMSNQSSNTHNKSMGGFGAYMRFINDIAMADVWVIDRNLELITYGNGEHNNYTYKDLPDSAVLIIDEVFSGKITTSENFSKVVNTPTLTIGAPIMSKDNHVLGVVLLHTPVNMTNDAIIKGLMILFSSIGLAFLLSIALSVLLSLKFTNPLNKIKYTTVELAKGNYNYKTNIIQNDEIGELAKAVDILSSELYNTNEKAMKLDRMKNEFIANISHELRTPVTVIRGSLEALNDGIVNDPVQVKQYYEQMLSDSKGLQRLINDLLELSKLQNVDFQMNMSSVNICDIVNDAIRSARNIASEKGININLVITDTNCSFIGDYDRLRQMFMIVVDNAIKFSPVNSHIDIEVNKNNNLYVIIKDYGVGIPKEDLPYIFDKFYKNKDINNENGTGLGLAIAKQVAQRHNIDMDVDSEIGKGTKFIFVIHCDN